MNNSNNKTMNDHKSNSSNIKLQSKIPPFLSKLYEIVNVN